MLLSSSGPGHQILSLRIAGSNPASSTKSCNSTSCSFFVFLLYGRLIGFLFLLFDFVERNLLNLVNFISP